MSTSESHPLPPDAGPRAGAGAGAGREHGADHDDPARGVRDDVAARPSARKRPVRTGRRGRWKAGVERAVEDLANRLKQQYGQQLSDDKFAREFKRYVVFQLKRNLPPGPGRPPDAAITKAIELRGKGVTWDAVYLECIPGFKDLPHGKRQVLKSELRSKCRSRRNTARRRRRPRKKKH